MSDLVKCVQCGSMVEDPALSGVVCAACQSRDREADLGPRRTMTSGTSVLLALAAAPFFVSVRNTETSSVSFNGTTAGSSSSSVDYVAAALGATAIVLGLVMVAMEVRARDGLPRNNRRLVVMAVAIALGARHLIHGITG